ncbi:hypothetical protein COOONC_15486 [Cooperia oncophora]
MRFMEVCKVKDSDFVYIMKYATLLGEYYMQLEDDVEAADSDTKAAVELRYKYPAVSNYINRTRQLVNQHSNPTRLHQDRRHMVYERYRRKLHVDQIHDVSQSNSAAKTTYTQEFLSFRKSLAPMRDASEGVMFLSGVPPAVLDKFGPETEVYAVEKGKRTFLGRFSTDGDFLYRSEGVSMEELRLEVTKSLSRWVILDHIRVDTHENCVG